MSAKDLLLSICVSYFSHMHVLYDGCLDLSGTKDHCSGCSVCHQNRSESKEPSSALQYSVLFDWIWILRLHCLKHAYFEISLIKIGGIFRTI